MRGFVAARGAVLLGAALAVGATGAAEAKDSQEYTAGQWTGYAYTDDTSGQFTDCTAWASNDDGPDGPDVVMACAGDVPTMETLAAVSLLREHLPDLRIRVVNVVDLMRLQPASEHPHGLSDADFDALFTADRPVIFAYHGYPWLIHRLTYKRTNHHNIHVRGYKEEGTTTTPFDMTVLNNVDRFNLAMDVIDRVPRLGATSGAAREEFKNALIRHRQYIRTHGEDLPEIQDWQWQAASGPTVRTEAPEHTTPEA